MQIDWFTVIAQAINFLVLMWLLKRFFYKPILKAIATREKFIADQLADATSKIAEATKEQEDFQKKNAKFDKQRTELINNAKKEAEDIRDQLIAEARTEAEKLRAKSKDALINEEQKLHKKTVTLMKQEIFATAAKILHDLADISLEERIIALFIKNLEKLSAADKLTLTSASSQNIIITTAFKLSPKRQLAIADAIKEHFAIDVDGLQFKVLHSLISGIELSVGGHKLAWSIADYLVNMEKPEASYVAK